MNKELIIESVALLNTAQYDSVSLNEKRNDVVDRLKLELHKPKLKDYIKKHHVNERRFSQESGISASLINYWCKKNWNELTLTTRTKILDALDVDIEFE